MLIYNTINYDHLMKFFRIPQETTEGLEGVKNDLLSKSWGRGIIEMDKSFSIFGDLTPRL